MILKNVIKEEAIKNSRKIKVVNPESGLAEKVAPVVNLVKGGPLHIIILVFVIVSLYGLYELFGLVEPLLGAWTLVLSKLAEMSVVLSEQAAELSRLRSLLSEGWTPGSGSALSTANATGDTAIGWALLVKVKALFCYIKAVSVRVLNTVGLMLITSFTGAFSWLDWACTLFTDMVARAYSDPRGLLFNLLLFVCVGATVAVTALACFIGSFMVQTFMPSQSGVLQKQLWGWGLFFLGLLNPTGWFFGGGSKGGGEAAPGAGGAARGAVDVHKLSDKLDVSTTLLEDRLKAIQSDVNTAREELPENLRLLGEQGQASLDHAVERLSIKEATEHLVVVREIAQNTRLTSEVLRCTADLHAQADSIEGQHALSLSRVERVTSLLPDQLNRLELKLDGLSKDAQVLKGLSLDSGSTVELTSKAIRHMLQGKSAVPSKRRTVKKSPEEAPEWDTQLEGPSQVPKETFSFDDTNQGSSSSSDKRLFIPSALEGSASKKALSRTSSASTDSLSSSEELDGESDAFDWAAESAKALETVLSRLASYDFVPHENPLFEASQPDMSLSLSQGALNTGREVPQGHEYDAVAGAEAARQASRLADASKLTAEANWATAVSQGSRLRTRLNLLEQHRPQTALVHGPGLDRSALPTGSLEEGSLVVTPAMLNAARHTRLPFSLYGFAASGALQNRVSLVNVAVRRTIALSEANHPVADPALAQATADVAAQPPSLEWLELAQLLLELGL